MSNLASHAARRRANCSRDRSGIAAIEFAVIVPLMLVMFFGMVEFSSGVAVDRKVTLMARTLSDLTSQSTSVNDTDLTELLRGQRCDPDAYSSTPMQADDHAKSMSTRKSRRSHGARRDGACGAQATLQPSRRNADRSSRISDGAAGRRTPI